MYKSVKEVRAKALELAIERAGQRDLGNTSVMEKMLDEAKEFEDYILGKKREE